MSVQLTDVTLRDGLQMEAPLTMEAKLSLFRRLQDCDYSRLEITSFVHPKWVPQFGDSDDFCQAIFNSETSFSFDTMAFVPNEKGLGRLLKHPIPWAAAFVATSEAFNQKNVNQSVSDSLMGLQKVISLAHQQNRKVRVYVSTVFGCPYEGAQSAEDVQRVLKQVADLSPDEIALSDTIGVALPSQVVEAVEAFSKHFDVSRMALHLHDTYGLATAGAIAGYGAGVRLFDGSSGGLGGCPYAKGASGNVATEKLAYVFERMGEGDLFKKTSVSQLLTYLGQDLSLNLHSSIYEILQNGGELYGCE